MLAPSLEGKATDMKRFLACLAAVVILAGWMGAVESAAAGAEMRLVVRPQAAGTEVPVCAQVVLPADLAGAEAGAIRVEMACGGTTVPGQIVPTPDGGTELWWILPKAEARAPQEWKAALSRGPAPTKDAFSFADTAGDHLDVLFAGRPVARYMYASDTSTAKRADETYKPYLHVLAPDGTLLTKGPGGLYTHHRGIFIGWMKLKYDGNKVNDWWQMKGVRMVHQKFLEQTAGPVLARVTSLVHWNDGEGKPVVIEQRSMTVLRPGGATIATILFQSRLKAARCDIVLDGDPEHGGVHYRPADAVEKAATKYVFPKEDTDVKTERDLPWVAETYVLGRKKYSMLQMNDPGNPKGTIWSAYRDYGRFGAFFKKEVKKGETLKVRYAFQVMGGDLPSREALAAEWEAFAHPPAAEAAK